ncbi:phosphoenolpyruvate carboxykinase (ATP) [Caminicella sporogenes]|uniref:phosphoenolpyruvate carboxykinase (ATP) n=1 Tax=Caminicella sporogenes TaxID=166485 RepID=UPI0025401084|nr:phosphoenolpyruvate carboxykinase (ATP) [Caminicella sporogenes]WIF95190.1 phosphoenolpyruvate carboxykinase (ATP) [Caminicella sporogenes]
MATVGAFNSLKIGSTNPIFSQIRTTIETAFYRNNVAYINTVKEAYNLAVNSPGTIITDMSIFKPEKIGLDKDAKVLLFNDGEVTGRCAAARKIIRQTDTNKDEYAALLREAVYNTRYKKMYHATAVVGLDRDFMVRAHLLIPKGHENILYNWLLNFQYFNEEYIEMYKHSKLIQGEGDIYIFSDPDWRDERHPLGLTLFEPQKNCAAILGMRYFGEHKKGTLTLAWSIANRNGYICCHGGLKRYNLDNGKKFIVGVFGLSGSGKSTLTHERHNDKFDISILHDDAFIISTENKTSIALEPSYFDKTQDYPSSCKDNKYLLTVQNCGATMDENGKIVLVTEDIRNGNGRAIKSKLWTKNRLNKFDEPINAIIWLMKDPSLPPVLKINNPILAATMGATLATKRTSAERLAKGVNKDSLVIEPYANPFRTYPLAEDYEKFKDLFKNKKVNCYIFNTGFFMDKKISKEITIGLLDSIVEGKADFEKWGNFSGIEIVKIKGFIPNLLDENYVSELIKGIKYRINFISDLNYKDNGVDKLPEEAIDCLNNLIKEIIEVNKVEYKLKVAL